MKTGKTGTFLSVNIFSELQAQIHKECLTRFMLQIKHLEAQVTSVFCLKTLDTPLMYSTNNMATPLKMTG